MKRRDNVIPGSGSLISRRAFLIGAMAAATVTSCRPGTAAADLDMGDPIPADKRLSPEWLASLTDRGTGKVYSGAALQKIGMPVGGLCTGQLYLGGDGKLWRWNIFNQPISSPGEGQWYQHYPDRDFPIDQGFSLHIDSDPDAKPRSLDTTGFSDIAFRGEYPIGSIEYRDAACPVAVTLKAFSPFIPLDVERSSFPAVVMRYTVKNTGASPVKATLAGWMQNGVCLFSSANTTTRRNALVNGAYGTALVCDLKTDDADAAPRPDIAFEDWSKPVYTGWTATGTAFGAGPVKKSEMPSYMGDVGGDTERVVSSHASAPGTDSQTRDNATGTLTSDPFQISRKFVTVWLGGGNHPGGTCVNVVVGGTVVATATGANSNTLAATDLDVGKYAGKTAVIEIVDNETGAWGNIGVGRITFRDALAPRSAASDDGSMTLALLGAPASETATSGGAGALKPGSSDESTGTGTTPLTGSIARTVSLAPGASAQIDFVIAWHFPNLHLDGLGAVGNFYATKRGSALDVVKEVHAEFDSLAAATELWRATWYDSTLPYWFLDRTFANTSTLATTTALRFASGRFYGWEGVGLGVGTCTHVWHYAQAVARLFPELERDTRQRVDLGIALVPDTGVIEYRAELDKRLAVDGQAGTILRCYREHQMTTDATFLTANWPRIKRAFDPLFHLDPKLEGILQGPQLNTLDFDWYGQIAWLSSLYVAALRAGEAMAAEMGDAAFETKCRTVAENGTKNITARLFNGEYFYNLIDPAHPNSLNSGAGCEIDQVHGQAWAMKVGLPRVLPRQETVTALKALYTYNFTTDVGPYREVYPQGRWYATAGEGGLLIATFPKPGWTFKQAIGTDSAYAAGYFNECQAGYEHNVAAHMISEGLMTEGLAVERAVHDRYDGAKRNPYNEIEYGDHYARSMASYGVYLAACGYEYHGPKGALTFAPKITPENAKFAFTTAEGWGSYTQTIADGKMTGTVALKHGRLKLNTLTLTPPNALSVKRVAVTLNGSAVPATHAVNNGTVAIAMPDGVLVKAGQTLRVVVT